MNLSDAFPVDSDEWNDLASFLFGAYTTYATRPWLWVVFPPPRFSACLIGIVSQESAFNSSASGDAGASIGMAQFNDANVSILGADYSDGSWRYDPMSSGKAAALYMSTWLLTNPVAWVALCPGLGYPMVRYSWTHGISHGTEAISGGVAQVLDADDDAISEQRGLVAFMTWSAILWAPLMIAAFVLAMRRKRGLRKGRGRR